MKISILIEDTLKRSGKFSPTLLTMFTAWFWCITITTIDYFWHGFKMEIFLAMIGMAGGIKVTDALSKKLNSNNGGEEK